MNNIYIFKIAKTNKKNKEKYASFININLEYINIAKTKPNKNKKIIKNLDVVDYQLIFFHDL